MADEKKDTKDAAKDAGRKVSSDDLRDLDVLDAKVDKVKGGVARSRRKKIRD